MGEAELAGNCSVISSRPMLQCHWPTCCGICL